jgi:hypothetical protein
MPRERDDEVRERVAGELRGEDGNCGGYLVVARRGEATALVQKAR